MDLDTWLAIRGWAEPLYLNGDKEEGFSNIEVRGTSLCVQGLPPDGPPPEGRQWMVPFRCAGPVIERLGVAPDQIAVRPEVVLLHRREASTPNGEFLGVPEGPALTHVVIRLTPVNSQQSRVGDYALIWREATLWSDPAWRPDLATPMSYALFGFYVVPLSSLGGLLQQSSQTGSATVVEAIDALLAKSACPLRWSSIEPHLSAAGYRPPKDGAEPPITGLTTTTTGVAELREQARVRHAARPILGVPFTVATFFSAIGLLQAIVALLLLAPLAILSKVDASGRTVPWLLALPEAATGRGLEWVARTLLYAWAAAPALIAGLQILQFGYLTVMERSLVAFSVLGLLFSSIVFIRCASVLRSVRGSRSSEESS